LNVAVFRTFSKCYGLAALPLGYAVVPCALAEMLRRRGVGIPRSLNRLSVVAAAASLRDGAYLAAVREQVTAERARWLSTLRELNLRTCEWHGNFVFFETGRPHREFAAAMLSAGVNIGRSFPPLDGWARISIGLPEENALAQEALRALLR
jgi:histidinol-phosphate aminotransferase